MVLTSETSRSPRHRKFSARFLESTYRRFDVGADATDARADSPGSDGPSELESKPLLLGPGLSLALSTLPTSGSAPANCDEVDGAPVTASVTGGRDADWESIEDEG